MKAVEKIAERIRNNTMVPAKQCKNVLPNVLPDTITAEENEEAECASRLKPAS